MHAAAHTVAGVVITAVLSLAGCGTAPSAVVTSVKGKAFHGTAFGGIQPIAFSTIQFFAAGGSGYSSASVPLLAKPVITDVNGNFDITNQYTCPSPYALVYLTVSGGNPGLARGVNNSAISLVSMLGPCGDLTTNTFVLIDELTTVAAAYALQPFLTGIANLGAPPSNQLGLASAFQTANTLVNLGGQTPGNAPAIATVPAIEINTLGDVVSSCVNSNGSLSLNAPCGRLFKAATPTAGTAPTDTFQALLNIARNPSQNVGSIFKTVPPNGPYQPTLKTVPTDWTLGITYAAPDFRTPADIGIDSNGAVWIIGTPGTGSNGSSTVSALTLSGLQGSYLLQNTIYANLAIDSSDNIWLSNNNRSQVVALTNGGTRTSFTPFTGGGIHGPGPMAFDPAGNLWVVNNTTTVSQLSSSGAPISGGNGYYTGGSSGPVAIAVDAGGNVWTADSQSNTVSEMDNSGSLVGNAAMGGSGLASPSGVAIDVDGNAVVSNRTGASVTRFFAQGHVPATVAYSNAGLSGPISVAVDGANTIWAVNLNSGTLSELSATGAPLSSSNGYGSAYLTNPYRMALDSAGNVWVINLGTKIPGSGIVTQLVGASTPVVTPLSVAVKNGAIAQRP